MLIVTPGDTLAHGDIGFDFGHRWIEGDLVAIFAIVIARSAIRVELSLDELRRLLAYCDQLEAAYGTLELRPRRGRP
jgi:excinuclease UvrABC helicase subunit UvrB